MPPIALTLILLTLASTPAELSREDNAAHGDVTGFPISLAYFFFAAVIVVDCVVARADAVSGCKFALDTGRSGVAYLCGMDDAISAKVDEAVVMDGVNLVPLGPISSETQQAIAAQMQTATSIVQSLPQIVSRARAMQVKLREFSEAIDELTKIASGLASTPRWECLRCGYRWYGRTGIFPPTRCPKCTSPVWNKPPLSMGDRRPTDRVGEAKERERMESMGREKMRAARKRYKEKRNREAAARSIPVALAHTVSPSEYVPPARENNGGPPLPPGLRRQEPEPLE